MEKKDKLYIGIYLDYYGAMLTPHQVQIVRQYYDEDMSLSEIGRENGISPQGVRDTLRRAEQSLTEWESKLGLVAKTQRLRTLLTELRPKVDADDRARIDKALRMLDEE